MKHLVLLGGGAQHLQVPRELAHSPMPGVRVTLLTPAPYHVHLCLLPAWVAGRCGFEDIAVPLAPWAYRAQAHLVEADLQAVDPERRELKLTTGEILHYDALSIDASAVAHRESIPGARRHALFVRPVLQFLHLWEAVIRLSEQQILSLVVVGGDLPAIELAIAIQQRLRRRARVALVTGGGPPLLTEPEPFQLRVKAALRRSHVTLFEDRCDSISGRQMQLGRGMRLGCDAPLVAEPPGPPLWLFDSGMALDANGFLLTGPTLQSGSHPSVFASGELAVRSGREPGAPGRHPLFRPVLPGPQLGRNLRRFLAGGVLHGDDRSPPVMVDLLDQGEGRAMVRLGTLMAEGRWVGWVKRWRDQRLMARFGLSIPPGTDAMGMAATAPGEGAPPV